jgi:hypothetical protein
MNPDSNKPHGHILSYMFLVNHITAGDRTDEGAELEYGLNERRCPALPYSIHARLSMWGRLALCDRNGIGNRAIIASFLTLFCHTESGREVVV